MVERLSHEEFVKKAIVNLRKEGYKGIGGVMLYLPDEAPGASNADETLKKMGLA